MPLLGLLMPALPLRGCSQRPGTPCLCEVRARQGRDGAAPLLVEGYCPACDAMAVAIERMPGLPAEPLTCDACGAGLALPVLVVRRITTAG